MVDLRTGYLGLRLRSPLVASASPLTGTLDGLRRLEQAGAGAVVLPSLFEEQVTHELLQAERLLPLGSDSHPEAAAYFPGLDALAGRATPLRERPMPPFARAVMRMSEEAVTPGASSRRKAILRRLAAQPRAVLASLRGHRLVIHG